MSVYITAAFLLLNFAAADYNSAANGVVLAAKDLSSRLSGWNSNAGLQGALGVQNGFPALSSALGDYSSAVVGATIDDVDVASTSAVDSAVASLLSSLSEKAADFNAVGAGSIATGDLKEVAGPSEAIINGLVKVLGSDSAKWSSLSAGLTALESSLNAANKAYNVPTASFAANPTFSDSRSATSSVATTTPSGSSGVSSSSSKAASSSGSTGAVPVSRNGTAPSGSASHSKAPPVHNGVAVTGASLGIAAAGVAALLI